MNIPNQYKIIKTATPYLHMVLGEYKRQIIDILLMNIDKKYIILDDWHWIIGDSGQLCINIYCKIRAKCEGGIHFIPVVIQLLPSYPNDSPSVYLRKVPNTVINLDCDYIRNECVVDYIHKCRISGVVTLDMAISSCRELFSSCCPMYLLSAEYDRSIHSVQSMHNKTVSIIEFEKIKYGEAIGSGAFGIVFKGEYDGHPVAVKEIKTVNDRLLKNIREEISTQCQLDHPNIIKMYGCSYRSDRLVIVMELGDSSLTDFMQKNGARLNNFEKGKICYDIALGLYELHSHHIIHRDIKMDNILSVNGLMKITDFGLAKVLANQNLNISKVGSPATMAPEFFTGEPITIQADVYSFACVMEEVFSGIPIHSDQEFNDRSDLKRAIIQRNYRPTIHRNVPSQIQKIILQCFREACSRPSIDVVARQLYEYLTTIM